MTKDKSYPVFHMANSSKAAWSKLTSDAQRVYNKVVEVGDLIFENDFFHPKTPAIKRPYFETIVHNIGFLVASDMSKAQKAIRLMEARANVESKKIKATKPVTKKSKPVTKPVTKKRCAG